MSFAILPRMWLNAVVVFVRQRLVSQHAERSGQNREAIYRDAQRVKTLLEQGESQRHELQARIESLQAENAALRLQTQHDPFSDPDKVARYAAQAQAEGVSLPVAQRLLKILRDSAPPR